MRPNGDQQRIIPFFTRIIDVIRNIIRPQIRVAPQEDIGNPRPNPEVPAALNPQAQPPQRRITFFENPAFSADDSNPEHRRIAHFNTPAFDDLSDDESERSSLDESENSSLQNVSASQITPKNKDRDLT